MNNLLNKRGIGPVIFIILVFVAVLILPTILFALSGINKIFYQGIMVFLIISYVRGMGLEGPLMWIISGVLIYFLVFKYTEIAAGFYLIIIILTMGFGSVIVWSSNYALKGLKKREWA